MHMLGEKNSKCPLTATVTGRKTSESVFEDLVIGLCAYRTVGKSVDKWVCATLGRLASINEIRSRFAGSILQCASDDKSNTL